MRNDILTPFSNKASDVTMITDMNAEWQANPESVEVTGEKPPTAGL